MAARTGAGRDGDTGAIDPADHAQQADSLSMAFLLVLERLAPVERAVFLLHDVFGYDYPQIARIVDRSEVNCRQLAARARRRVTAEQPRFEASRSQSDRLARRFFAALQDGDLTGLIDLLAADAVAYGDGGGKAPQWPGPIIGAERVARILAGAGRVIKTYDLRLEPQTVNGQPGALVRTVDGRLVNVYCLEIIDGRVSTVRSVINPDKLRHLGPVADLPALRDAHRRG